MSSKYKFIKTVFLIVGIILIIGVIISVLISPLAKFLVEKYDKKYTGRQITMNWAYVNPFTSYLYFSDLKIYEYQSDSVFIGAKGLSIDFELLKLFSKTIEISAITLDHPIAIAAQNKKEFNFDDIIRKFTPKKPKTKPSFHFNILGIKINDGIIHYREKGIPINYFIENVNIKSPGKRWDNDTLALKFSFASGIGGGQMKGDFSLNTKTKDYSMAIVAEKFDLSIIDQYLHAITNYGSFRAKLDADVKSRGNFKDPEEVTNSGLITISDLHLGKNPKDDYVSFKRLVLAIKEISPKKHVYFFDSILLSQPYIKYERYDELDNLQTMFGKSGSNISSASGSAAPFNLILEIAKNIELISKNFFQSDYKINRLALSKGDIRYNDYSLNEKFALQLNPISVHADSIDKTHTTVNGTLKSKVKPYGSISVALSMNPRESGNFDLHYNFSKIPVSMFNPYIVSKTSFPLDRGTIELNGKWKVRNSIIQSTNHLVIIDPGVAKKIKKKDLKQIPLPLILSFVRERGNVIDYEIPITGNLKNPKFHIRDVISDLLRNIFVKPPTTPYGMKVKNIEREIEKSLTFKWEMRENSLKPDQEKFIKHMADFLKKTPDANITVYPKYYAIDFLRK